MESRPYKKKGEESARDLAADEEREIDRQGRAAREAPEAAPVAPEVSEAQPDDLAWERP